MWQKILPVILFSLGACSSYRVESPQKEATRNISKRDFFFYNCVHEYMKKNSIQNFDASVGLAVELSKFSFEELNEINKSAKNTAFGIRAPDYSDEEHGLPAVLIICQDESEKIYQD